MAEARVGLSLLQLHPEAAGRVLSENLLWSPWEDDSKYHLFDIQASTS